MKDAMATGSSASLPYQNKTPGAGGTEGLRRQTDDVANDQGKTLKPDYAVHRDGDSPSGTNHKRFATLRARLARAGWGLIRTDPSDGAPVYFATRWSMPRELVDLAAVEAFADKVEAKR